MGSLMKWNVASRTLFFMPLHNLSKEDKMACFIFAVVSKDPSLKKSGEKKSTWISKNGSSFLGLGGINLDLKYLQ